MLYFKIIFKITFIILFVFNSVQLFAQVRKDTVYSHNSDTMTVRYFKKDGKAGKEKNYLNGYLVSVKNWYYGKDYYGYKLKGKGIFIHQPEYRKEFYADGKLKVEGTFLYGKPAGVQRSYYANGHPQCTCNFEHGKNDGTQVIQNEGDTTQNILSFTDGKLNGTQYFYHSNGNIWCEEIWADGKLQEVLFKKDREGNPMDYGTFKDGNGTLFNYNEDGKITIIEHFKNGVLIKSEKQ